MIGRLAEIAGRPVSRETLARLECFAELLRREAATQNLISASSTEQLWDRHILDSAQLVRFEAGPGCAWVDVGAGAGLPGLVIATVVEGPVTLVEPRKLRADFLRRAILQLGLERRVTVVCAKAERVAAKFDVITARAVATLDRLLPMAHHLSTDKTVWILPKGRNARSELDEARRSWQCKAEIVRSRSDPESEILMLRRVTTKGKR